MSLDDQQSFELEGVGTLKVKRRRGQKSTSLRVARGGEIVITTNYSTPLYSLKKFADMHRLWLIEIQEKSGLNIDIEIFDDQILCPGIKFKLVVDPSVVDGELSFKYRKVDGQILIHSSVVRDSVHLSEIQRAEMEVIVVKALRRLAKKVLVERLRLLAIKMGAQYGSVTIRNTSSRWGSCSSNNDINLSLWLMLLPQELIDYVLIHELVHTEFKHHKPEFWDAVAVWCPNHKVIRTKLKKHSGQIWW